MGPKKKGGKGGGKGGKGKKKKAKEAPPDDGMTKEQYEVLVAKLREELERERSERNFFQLECERVKTFWDITKRDLEDKKADVRNMESAGEEAEQRHQVEIKIFKQKVKHLLHEHKEMIDELRSENIVALKLAGEQHYIGELELLKEKRNLKEEMKHQQVAHEETVKALKKLHAEAESNLTAEHERNATEIEAKYQAKIKTLKLEDDLRRKTELHELEERKNLQVHTLMKNHEKAFNDIKNYYNEITLNNLTLINTMKEEVEDMRRRTDVMDKHVAELTNENKSLKTTLVSESAEVAEMRAKTADYDKMKSILASTKYHLKRTTEQLRSAELESEIMEQRYNRLMAERTDIYSHFVDAVHEVFQKTSFKNLVLEKKLVAIRNELEQLQAKLGEIVASVNLDPASLQLVTQRIAEVLNAKNLAIGDLQYEVTRVCKAHYDLMHTYEGRLKELGIATEETGFVPIKTRIRGHKIGKGPAGLVSAAP